MYKGHGAIVIGSETSGDIRNIVASNIVAKGTDRGIRIKSMRGRGGIVENVRCDNFVIEDAPAEAIEITTYYVGARSPKQPVSDATPVFRNFTFSHITIINAHQVASVEGLPEKPIEAICVSPTSGRAAARASPAARRPTSSCASVRVDGAAGDAFTFEKTRDLVLDDVGSRSSRRRADCPARGRRRGLAARLAGGARDRDFPPSGRQAARPSEAHRQRALGRGAARLAGRDPALAAHATRRRAIQNSPRIAPVAAQHARNPTVSTRSHFVNSHEEPGNSLR